MAAAFEPLPEVFLDLDRYVPTNALAAANLRSDVEAGCELSCSGGLPNLETKLVIRQGVPRTQ
jgi:hypothetical protein